jgi:hypothetical protein
MQMPSKMTCDRCGAPKHYITLKGTNGMIAWEADVCRPCYADVAAMMLHKIRLFQKDADE